MGPICTFASKIHYAIREFRLVTNLFTVYDNNDKHYYKQVYDNASKHYYKQVYDNDNKHYYKPSI
jgi:hypothetical protein